mmetsp:Transcript_109207/g.315547  ORF Transcript_109207/g.315547 Transcript_109207/m.315547 type:complete len:555 (-) Transcript_109207:135-1799(-)
MSPGDLFWDVITFGHLSTVDAVSILIYLATLLLVTLYVNYKVGGADSEAYFLGGRDIPWWAVGFSLFASNLGTDHLVGLAGSGAAQGLAVGCWEWSASYVLLVLGWVFVPHYLEYGIYTVPEYLEHRFESRMRKFFTWVSILSALFTKIAVTIFAGAVVLNEVLGWSKWFSSVLLLTLTGVYTSIGGLAAVVYTEVLQSIVLLVGCTALLWYGLDAVGGWKGLEEKLPASHFDLMKPANHQDFPWPGVVFGMPISGLWYWCTDQVMVQRVLSAKSVGTGQSACVFAGWLKLTPMFLMVLPGLIAAALYPEDMERDSNRAFAVLVSRLLPPGWQGAMIAVMLSSFMAALASCFNSCSTLFTMDIYAEWYPEHTERELVIVGQLFTIVLAVASMAWLPMIDGSGDELFVYIQSMQLIWCAPIAAVFLCACLSKRISSRTAWITLTGGIAVGVVFWLLRSGLPVGYRMASLQPFCVLYFGMVHFLFSFLVIGICSFFEQTDLEATDEEKAKLIDNCPSFQRTTSLTSVNQEHAGTMTNVMAVSLMVAVVVLGVWLGA